MCGEEIKPSMWGRDKAKYVGKRWLEAKYVGKRWLKAKYVGKR